MDAAHRPDRCLSIHPATPKERAVALGMLTNVDDADDRRQQVMDLVRSADAGDLDLSGLFVARWNGGIVGAAFAMIQPERMAFVWPPAARLTASDVSIDVGQIGRALLSRLGEWLDDEGIAYSQMMIDAGTSIDPVLRESCGFRFLAELQVRERPMDRALPSRRPISWVTQPYAEDEVSARFARVIERSYVDSRDCPRFTGRRKGVEAIQSHRLAGVFDPSRWTLFTVDGEDVAVLLMTSYPADDIWELIYMGVVPEARGRGLGREIVLFGLEAARAANVGRVSLCNDAENDYAKAVYESLGLRVCSTKTVHLRWRGGDAGEVNPQREHTPSGR